MALITNTILREVRALIGIGQGITAPTVLDDDSVSMTFPVVPDIARRGLSVGGAGGIFQGILENVHTAADDERSAIMPYTAGPDAAPGFPAAISRDFDLWLLSASVVKTSGGGTLPGAALFLRAPLSNNPTLGFGRDDAGAPVTNNTLYPLAFWNAFFTGSAGSNDFGINDISGDASQDIGVRLPRGCELVFDTTSTETVTIRVIMQLGLFPAGLGQDVAT